MTTIAVVPAGNALFEVTLDDAEGTQTIEFGIPDDTFDELDIGEYDVSLHGVVLEAMALALQGLHRENLPPELSLQDLRDRIDGFDEKLLERLELRGTEGSDTSTGMRLVEGDDRSSDDRLVTETIDAQEAGQASRQTERF